jgi:hypothetical protein
VRGGQAAPDHQSGDPGPLRPRQTQRTGRDQQNEQGGLVGDIGGRAVDDDQGGHAAAESCRVGPVSYSQFPQNEQAATDQPSPAFGGRQRRQFCEECLTVLGAGGWQEPHRPAQDAFSTHRDQA